MIITIVAGILLLVVVGFIVAYAQISHPQYRK